MDWLTNNAMRLNQKNLDFLWRRQRTISENIANAETPGYKAKYVSFEEDFRRRLADASKTHRGKDIRAAINDARATVSELDTETMRLDGNSVNADVENIELARAQLQYEFAVKQMNDQFTRLRTAIGGR